MKYKVHLTFDDGPHLTNTPQVLDVLKKHNISSTFFVLGEKVESSRSGYQGIVQRMVQEGHKVGSHSFSHLKHTQIPPQEARRLISSSVPAIEQSSLEKPIYFRLPYGDGWNSAVSARNRQIKQIVDTTGLKHIGWHIDSYDSVPSLLRGQKPLAHLLQSICEMQGGIVLMHDTIDKTAATLEQQIEAIQCVGHTFTGIDDFAEDPFFEIRQDMRAIFPAHYSPRQFTRRTDDHQHSETCTHANRRSSGWLSRFLDWIKRGE